MHRCTRDIWSVHLCDLVSAQSPVGANDHGGSVQCPEPAYCESVRGRLKCGAGIYYVGRQQ
jgi:hypothetical protein